ncbi:uncharacterized protein LOC101855795 [Aplysia californica]|uniref:Uncharacterized protein LOC101855795 n=1 Tax=Aplysia californica TaxID=6500 RepID=A0ABM1A1M0_APLCA|nr:uncharacterized protein LOC101855795 [Aplysia californica]
MMSALYRPEILLLQWWICFLHYTGTLATRCAFRGLPDDPWGHHDQSELPPGEGFKECPWGCCWEQKYDICCSFPMEVIIMGVVAVLLLIVVVAAVVTVVCCLAIKRRDVLQESCLGKPICCYGNDPVRIANTGVSSRPQCQQEPASTCESTDYDPEIAYGVYDNRVVCS